MRRVISIVIACAVLFSAVVPFGASAAAKTPFYYGGWIPFWRQRAGAYSAAVNLNSLNEVSPFSYEVLPGGKIVDDLKINEGFWPTWRSAARALGVKMYPTIAWFDGDAIQALLSNKKTRIAHENAITNLVKTEKFDGIDIDYESKLTETNHYFSLFLEGLAIRLHPLGKKLICTIEPRMPVSSRYGRTGTPADTEYANNYAAINKYCDEVRVMAYDQGLVDIKLDEAKGNGTLYAPVADPDWAAKVLREALKSIKKGKIMLGVPTYGYEYEVSWANGRTTYKRLRSHTFFQALSRAVDVGTVPLRNAAGELGFAYATSTSVTDVSPSLTWSVSSTEPAVIAANDAKGLITRYVSFTDSYSSAQSIALAKKLGLRGVVFFKLDGDQDPLIWNAMK